MASDVHGKTPHLREPKLSMSPTRVNWPHGKRFCFTIIDDPDFGTVQNTKPIYDFLASLGMRTTRLVWPLPAQGKPFVSGQTCADSDQLEWLLSLPSQGFELGLHHVAPGSSTRETTLQGLNHFRQLFGANPRVHANHTGCRENIYWGSDRLSSWRRWLYNLRTIGARADISRGHIESDPHFWGDLCQQRITYVRNFTCDSLNTLQFCPSMPYHDPQRPFVNYWFAATNASSPKYFLQNFDIPRIDRLIAQGGLCIAYVHFGIDFFANHTLNPHFRQMIEYLAARQGWFAPVGEVLDFLRGEQNLQSRAISPLNLAQLELKWSFGKFTKKAGI